MCIISGHMHFWEERKCAERGLWAERGTKLLKKVRKIPQNKGKFVIELSSYISFPLSTAW